MRTFTCRSTFLYGRRKVEEKKSRRKDIESRGCGGRGEGGGRGGREEE
jgi:hypothetical protein